MKLTPADVHSLKDQSKWADFTYTNEDPDNLKVDDGTNF